VRVASARRALAHAAAILIVTAVAVGAAAPPAAATHTVVIENLQFSPKELTVSRGDRIVWVNKDLFPHTATAEGKAFDSQSIAANASWSYVASKPGTYPYGCTFHPTMKATLTVK
jgi:plastocyanin